MTFREDLVACALAQWEWFGRDVGRQDKYVNAAGQTTGAAKTGGQANRRKETVEPYAGRVADYWLVIPTSSYDSLVKKYGGGKGKLDGTINLPWSAAFISYCMQMAGAGSAFPYSSGHATWIVKSIKSRQKNQLNASLVGYRPGEHPLEPGDLIGRPRGENANLTYDQAVAKGWFTSHTDIVVAVDRKQRKAFVVGGNVGQSVSKCEVTTDADGRLVETDGWFVHIRNNIASKTVVAYDPADAQVG